MSESRDPWAELKPMRPPEDLRARVLLAAREASTHPTPALLEALYRDRLLRACAAGLAALAIANALVAGGGGAPSPVAAPIAIRNDDAVPGDVGLTASEQMDELAPVLGDLVARSRG
jgi:hypothetical protein